MCWLSQPHVYDIDSEEVVKVFLDYLPNVEAWSMIHLVFFIIGVAFNVIICAMQAILNYFCCATNPKRGATVDISQVVVGYVISYYDYWRNITLPLYYAIIIAMCYDSNPFFRINGAVLYMITYVEASVILLIGAICTLFKDHITKTILAAIAMIALLIICPILIAYFVQKLPEKSGGFICLEEKSAEIETRSPKRPPLFMRVEVEDDIPIIQAEQEEEKKLDDEKEQDRIKKEKWREEGLTDCPKEEEKKIKPGIPINSTTPSALSAFQKIASPQGQLSAKVQNDPQNAKIPSDKQKTNLSIQVAGQDQQNNSGVSPSGGTTPKAGLTPKSPQRTRFANLLLTAAELTREKQSIEQASPKTITPSPQTQEQSQHLNEQKQQQQQQGQQQEQNRQPSPLPSITPIQLADPSSRAEEGQQNKMKNTMAGTIMAAKMKAQLGKNTSKNKQTNNPSSEIFLIKLHYWGN
ncbi:MAG: hypothetical protein EZS28_018282 [Streblomastix strix]|uniref:Uncharacterized protein n=1 Tax=Streblomastix strix TaxID=222440 RepID=A0A5J4VUX8_9EUKA|nr:MAG: hypothetical protein EZS28_018282 [Streblomastix strix]